MKRVWIIVSFLLVLLAIPLVSLRFSTLRRTAQIEALQGQRGEFTNLVAAIKTHYHTVTDSNELEHARARLGFQSVSNLFIVRFSGEGIPYFYGWVAYDTGKQEIVRAVVDQLW